MGETLVTITKEEYEYLLKQNRFLSCLENAGVDNWHGYSYAWELMEEIMEMMIVEIIGEMNREEAQKVYHDRVELFMSKYGMRWRTATGFASEMEYIQNRYDYKDFDRLIEVMMNIALEHGRMTANEIR